MSWESRKGLGRYYTRSRRRGGRVVREYLGIGERAIRAAKRDGSKRRKRLAELKVHRERVNEADALEAEVAVACDLAELLSRAALLAVGYRQHHRSEWRKRHVPKRDS